MYLATGSRAIHQGDQEHRGGHPEDSKEGEWPDRHQGVRHWAGCACSLGPGSWQADPPEWTALTGDSQWTLLLTSWPLTHHIYLCTSIHIFNFDLPMDSPFSIKIYTPLNLSILTQHPLYLLPIKCTSVPPALRNFSILSHLHGLASFAKLFTTITISCFLFCCPLLCCLVLNIRSVLCLTSPLAMHRLPAAPRSSMLIQTTPSTSSTWSNLPSLWWIWQTP